MDDTQPRYTFRVFSNESNGTNSPNFFEPASGPMYRSNDDTRLCYNRVHGSLLQQLKKALLATKAPLNPFIFTTSSLLLALQHAIRKDKNKENVQIVCIDTEHARTPEGETIHFEQATDVMNKLSTVSLKARWTSLEIDYSGVWVATDTIVPGYGSSVVSFQTLKETGLFHLYIELDVINRRSKPGLEKPVADLRNFWFASSKDLSHKRIALAAKLASTFQPVREEDSTPPFVETSAILVLSAQEPQRERRKSTLLARSILQSPRERKSPGE